MDKNSGHFLFVKKFIVLIFAVNFIAIISLLIVFITSLSSSNTSVVESKMERVRVSFDKEVMQPLNTMAFAVRNQLLHEQIQQKNHIELIRWISDYRRSTDVDGCLLMSVEGEVLAKTEFFRFPYSDKFSFIIDETLKGDIISSLDFFDINNLDEGMRFRISQRVSQEIGIDQEKGKAFMIIRAMPVYRRTGEMIAVFLTTTILNNNTRFVSEITYPAVTDPVAIISYDEVVAYLADSGESAKDLISRIDFESVKEMSADGLNSFRDEKNKVAYIPLKGYISENTIGFFALSYTNGFLKDNLWKFAIFVMLFFIVTLAICIHYFNYTRDYILKPWDKIVSIFSMIESGAKKLPLVTREDKISPFGDIFKIIHKLSPVLKQNSVEKEQKIKSANSHKDGSK